MGKFAPLSIKVLLVATILTCSVVAKKPKATVTGRPPSQIYMFEFIDPDPCESPDACTDNPNRSLCGDGTWCNFNYRCGFYAGKTRCCQDLNAGYKNTTFHDSCAAKDAYLGNITLNASTSNVTSVYPSSVFCNINSLPGYQLPGDYRNANQSLVMGAGGVVCCPNYLDSIDIVGPDLKVTYGLCVAPKGQNIKDLSKSTSVGASISGRVGKAAFFAAIVAAMEFLFL